MIQKDESSRITFVKLYDIIKSYREKDMGSGIKDIKEENEGK
jgi:hypothetical protein